MLKINSKNLPITAASTERNASSWLRIIRYNESGTVIQIQDDCEYRVPQVIENPPLLKKYLGPYYRKHLLGYVPIDNLPFDKAVKNALIKLAENRKIQVPAKLDGMEIKDIIKLIGDRGFEIGLFITRITHLLDKIDFHTFLKLEFLLEQCKNFSVVIFLEKDVIRPEYKLLVDKCSLLFDHLLYYPLYEEADVRHFIRYYSRLWHHRLTKEQEEDIIEACGGYLWLVSQVHKYLRDNPNDTTDRAWEDPLLLHKLSIIWDKFSPKEKRVLKKVAQTTLTSGDKETPEYLYLGKINLIKRDGLKDVLGIPLLSKIIDHEEILENLRLDKGQIVKGEEDITFQFSPKEKKLMTLLLARRKKLVKRDDIARVLWGKGWEDKYSDWAIDRIICRLRKKLSGLEIDKNLIKTAKKKGIIYG